MPRTTRIISSREVRQQFIGFFQDQHGHDVVPSSPVVPHNDPTLLFANAGMNQFKDVFLGLADGVSTAGGEPGGTGGTGFKGVARRAVNSQKCIRAGGKHNDLEDVGKDTYHHTFFEMLGNWSFGDYFKAEAIAWAWQLLTDVWGLSKDRLYATVFAGDQEDGLEPDTEAGELWTKVTDIDPAHVSLWGKKDNFWEMGTTGPCGPCSEVHIDVTTDLSGGALVNQGDPRVIELWNLVFIQFNRDSSGRLTPLPAEHVDTGLGLERTVRILQGVNSNYDTDVFSPLFDAIRDVAKARPYGGSLQDTTDVAYRVIADHVRCLTFALTDGAVPSNEGRGYVLRRILRRAVRHGWQTLGMHEPFVFRLVPAVVDAMADAFPELKDRPQHVMDLIRDEEVGFGRTLDRGIALFEDAARRGGQTIGGADAFMLHDTYGFPLDLTQLMAQERGLGVDEPGFNELMEKARQMARLAGARRADGQVLVGIVQKHSPPATVFSGYEASQEDVTSFSLLFALKDDGHEAVASAGPGDRIAVVTVRTPFYAEAGGQVGDTGQITNDAGGVFRVQDTQKAGDVYFHVGVVENGTFTGGEQTEQRLSMRVEMERRRAIMANHTSTHLLNRALRLHVRDGADQKGSLVDDQKLRFDFSHNAPLTLDQLDQVEHLVNADIAADLPVYAGEAPLEDGRRIKGLRAVFGEKYPQLVRIVSVGVPVQDLTDQPDKDDWSNYSVEFCGGTHVTKTGDAEGFVVISEEAVAKGVRRITAITGAAAHQASAQADLFVNRLDGLRQAPPQDLAAQLTELTRASQAATLPALSAAKLREGIADLQRVLKDQQKKVSRLATAGVVEASRDIAESADGPIIVASIDGADAGTLRDAMDVIRKKRPEAAMLLGAASGKKVSFLAAVPKALIDQGLKAGDWVKQAAKVAGGGGGGRPDMAQAGGKQPEKLQEALDAGRAYAQSTVA